MIDGEKKDEEIKKDEGQKGGESVAEDTSKETEEYEEMEGE